MTELERKIKRLNWFDFLRKLKEILLELLGLTSGGVESVTGDLVDNTDPQNPVINKNYTSYIATLSQTGSYTPVVNVLENDLPFSVEWRRTGTGRYEGVFSETIDSSLLYVSIAGKAYDGKTTIGSLMEYLADASRIEIGTFKSFGSLADSILRKTAIEIRYYKQ